MLTNATTGILFVFAYSESDHIIMVNEMIDLVYCKYPIYYPLYDQNGYILDVKTGTPKLPVWDK